MAGFTVENAKAVLAVEEGAIDAATVGRIIVNISVTHATEASAVHQLPHHRLILYLRQADDIRHLPELIPCKADGLGDAVALVPEVGLCLEKVLYIPEHQYKNNPFHAPKMGKVNVKTPPET